MDTQGDDDGLSDHYRWLATWARATTIESRMRTLRRFARATGVQPIAATREDVEVWYESLTITARARSNEVAHLSAFYAWAVLHERRTDNPTARIRRPRLRPYMPRPIPIADVRAALDHAPARIKPMLLLMVGCGLRSCEVAQLTAGDVHRNPDGSGRIFVRDGKGGKQRWVPAPAVVIESLHGLPRRGHLFVRQDGLPGPINAHRVSALVNNYLHDVCGIEETAHALRHTYATHLYAESGDLMQVREVLGHGSVQTTQVYVAVSQTDAAGAASRALERFTRGTE